MTITIQVTEQNRIMILCDVGEDAQNTIRLNQQHGATKEQEKIIKSGPMTWKAGCYLLTVTNSGPDVEEENQLQIVRLTDSNDAILAEMEINKSVYEFFRDRLDEVLETGKDIAEGFD